MLHEIDKNLVALEADLSAIQLTYPNQVKTEATDRVNWEIAEAEEIDKIKHELLKSGEKATVQEIKAMALLRRKDLYKKYRESEAIVDGQKKKIDVLQSILMSTQTRAKLAMIERGLTNFQ